mmetsp:Transcript_19871/g.41250  ORF Transcript_19871/g.41250 Transcript_19871/m.41250 type:complete len:347 (-) Transcript_19871:157-1197(-)
MVSSTNSAAATVIAALLATSTSAFVPASTAPALTLSRTTCIPAPTMPTSTALPAIRRGGGGRGRGPPPKKEFVPPMNDEIKQTELRVSVATKDGKDESLGVMSKMDALAKAKELGGLDLILINANSDPVVCKIVDYSKYRYMLEKKRKEKAKNSKATEIKEVKMSYKIGEHDYGVRLKAASKFIRQGNRVKATVMFRGREVQHDKLGEELLNKLAKDLEDVCNMEGRPRREGRSLGAILSPRAEVVKAINDAKRLKEKEKKKAKAESLKKREEMEAMKMNGTTMTLVDEDEDDEDDDDEGDDFGGVLDGIDIDDEDDEDFDLDDDDVDASLDELLGSDKVADDLFN